MRPFAAPGLASVDLLRPKEPPKIDPFLGPLKIDPVGGKVAPWPPFGRQGLHLAYFRFSFVVKCFIIFLILFRPPQNLVFALPYGTFACFRTLFLSLVRPHFGTTFGRAFWPFLAPQGAERASPCRFWTIFGTPPGSKMEPWSDQGRPEKPKQASRKLCGGGPVCVLEAPCFPKGSREPFLSIFETPWVTKAHFWDPLG